MSKRAPTLAELSIDRQIRGRRRAAFRAWWESRVAIGNRWAAIIPVTAAVLLSLLAWRLLA